MSPKIVSEVVRSSKQMNLLWSHIRWVTPESPLNPNFEDWAAAAPCSAFSSVPGGALQVCLCFRQQLPPAVLQEKCSCSFSLGALERAVASLYPARCVPWHVWLTWLGGFPAVQVFLWLQATDLAPCARFTYSNSLLCNCTWNRQELSECNLFMLVYILLHHFIADFAFEGSGSRVEVHRHTVLTNSFLERATPFKGQLCLSKADDTAEGAEGWNDKMPGPPFGDSGCGRAYSPSLLDLLCPGHQPETWLGSSGVQQEAGASPASLLWAPQPLFPAGSVPRLPAGSPRAAAPLRLKALAFIYSPPVFPSLCWCNPGRCIITQSSKFAFPLAFAVWKEWRLQCQCCPELLEDLIPLPGTSSLSDFSLCLIMGISEVCAHTFVLTEQINPTIFQTELMLLLNFCICFY